jgi:hypothetical protein
VHHGPQWEFLSETPRHRMARHLAMIVATALALIIVMAVILNG